MSAIQIIDENKQFCEDVDNYFRRFGIESAGLDYHVVAVFGSQSTGKSTLLNALFGTEFGVMDVSSRQQTTKGIWMGVELPLNSSSRQGAIASDNSATNINFTGTEKNAQPLLILDVEGTDGRERGEDQDFERKAALFALATSEVLIINMWEHQVGLYVGANMALLRTVFEVNLSLFQAGRGQVQRSYILFAIRDHMGLTPLEKLAETLREDLNKQWESVTKPESLQSSKLEDFFDLGFVGLPHKVLQADQFNAMVPKMHKDIEQNFKPEYHRQVPLDGWSMYAGQVWQQIELNKDLDLPTHQILVARFRCEEISNTSFTEFENSIANLCLPFGEVTVIEKFGELLRKQRSATLGSYDELAGRYHKTVYNEKRLELMGRIDGVLTAYFASQLAALKAKALTAFQKHMEETRNVNSKTLDSSQLTFKDRIDKSAAFARSVFITGADEAVIDTSFFSYRAQQEELEVELVKEMNNARQIEIKRILKRVSKVLAARIDSIDQHFSRFPDKLEYPWDAVEETLNNALSSVYREYADELDLGCSESESNTVRLLVESEAWRALNARLAKITSADSVLQRMRDRFEDVFKYSPDGLPIVWSPDDDIESCAVRARGAALRLLPVLSSARLKNGTILTVPIEVAELIQQNEDDVPDFSVLLSNQDQKDIERRFQRLADSAFIDAKRSVMQLTTHIPLWIYAVITILGWNEFTMVLRNPILLMLVLILGVTAYFVWSMGLTGPVLNVIESSVDRLQVECKAYLRQILLDDKDTGNKFQQNRDLKFPLDQSNNDIHLANGVGSQPKEKSPIRNADIMEAEK